MITDGYRWLQMVIDKSLLLLTGRLGRTAPGPFKGGLTEQQPYLFIHMDYYPCDSDPQRRMLAV